MAAKSITKRTDKRKAFTLKSATIDELVLVYDAFQAARAAILGIVNQPRCTDRIGTLIDNVGAVEIDRILKRVVKLLMAAKPDSAQNHEYRSEYLARWMIECQDYANAAKYLIDADNPILLDGIKSKAAVLGGRSFQPNGG